MENQFSINNSFWFITGTFLRQGSGLNPKVTDTPAKQTFKGERKKKLAFLAGYSAKPFNPSPNC